MKTLFLLLIIYNLQNYVCSQDPSTIIYKSYPKKVHLGQDNVKVVNPGTYYKKLNERKSFTRFQPPLHVWPEKKKMFQALPEETNLFSIDAHGDLKSRVKKLSYFKDSMRVKRAVNESKPEDTTKVSATQKTEAAKPKENQPTETTSPKNASLSRRKNVRVGSKLRTSDRIKVVARQGNISKTSRLRTFGKMNLKGKRGLRQRKSRSRVLRASNDKIPKEKEGTDKSPKEKSGNYKTPNEKPGKDKTPKERAGNDKTPNEKAGNDKPLKKKAGNDNVPKVKAGNDKALKGKSNNDMPRHIMRAGTDKASKGKAGTDKAPKNKAGNDKAPKDKSSNDKVPKEKAVDTKQEALKGKARKQAGKVEPKRRAPSKRDSKASRPVASRRLIAASDAHPEDYPYVVSIQKDNEHWCTGAILNPQLIISTANCFWKSRAASRMRVRAGAQSVDTGGQVANIAEVRKHPNWSIRKFPQNDIALALLDKQLKFSNAVHGVDLPNKVMLPAFNDAWVTSYGAERRDGVFSRQRKTMQVSHMQIMPDQKCADIVKRFGVPLHHSFFCLEQVGRRAPCTRDTGAPAVSDGVLWGLASWGIRKLCGTQRFPAMFSYVAEVSNIKFIVNATSEMMGDERNSPFLDRPPPRPRPVIVLPGEKRPPMPDYN